MAIPAQPNTDPTHTGGTHARRLAFTLRTPGFPVLCGAALCSQIGAGMQQVLLGWLVLSMTDSSSMVGVLFAVRSLPNLLAGFAAGVITDRLDRRILMRVMVWGSCKPSSSQHGRCIPVMSWASAVLYKVLLSSP